jgi:hypothetical protein
VSVSEERAARNEAAFRAVNETIVELEERLQVVDDPPSLICECADPRCAERLPVPQAVHERVRQNPRHFLVRPGHERPELETVLERHRNYLVVEKTGRAGDIAERNAI